MALRMYTLRSRLTSVSLNSPKKFYAIFFVYTFCIVILHSAYHSSEPKHPQDAASDVREAAAAPCQAEETAGAQAKDRGSEPH